MSPFKSREIGSNINTQNSVYKPLESTTKESGTCKN